MTRRIPAVCVVAVLLVSGVRRRHDGAKPRIRAPQTHRNIQVNCLERDQAREDHQPEVEHQRCHRCPSIPLRERFAKGPE